MNSTHVDMVIQKKQVLTNRFYKTSYKTFASEKGKMKNLS